MLLTSNVFDSDSEYKQLFLIQTINSYNLNHITSEAFIWQNGMSMVKISKKLEVNDLLLSAIDETMRQIFNETGTKVIYDYLMNNHHLKLEEFAEKPEVFSAGLERLIGSGAKVIEILVLKNFYSELGLKFEEKKAYAFPDYIKELRKSAVAKAYDKRSKRVDFHG